MDLPVGFIDLATAYRSADNSFVNIIGTVVDVMDPTKCKNGEWMFTFKLLDERLSRSVDGSQGLTCKFFRRDLEGMPKVRKVGDAVLLRNVRVYTYQGTKLMLSNYQTEATTFAKNSIPSPVFSIAYKTDRGKIERLGVPQHTEKLNLAEQEYVIHLNEAMRPFVDLVEGTGGSGTRQLEEAEAAPQAKRQKLTTPNAKLKSIKDLRGHGKMWADIYAIVVKRIGVTYGCDLYVTDYTENEAVRRYPEPEEDPESERDGDVFGYNGPKKKGWKGPWGHTILKVNLKPPHAQFANAELKEDDLVLLRNVKTRITPEGAWLEGDMWPDDKERNKVQIRKIKDNSLPEIQEIMKRKEKYWAKRKAKLAQKEAAGKPLTKKERKKQRRREAKEANPGATAADGPQASETGHSTLATKSNTRPPRINPNVKCAHEEVALSRIKDVVDVTNLRHTNEMCDGTTYTLPFINTKHRARVRVVDFEPKCLEDFSIQPEPADGSSPHSTDWAIHTPTYEWYFSLLLEDAIVPPGTEAESHRIWVQVHHDWAQYLLGSNFDDPDDLRHNNRLLAKLREKLFILWGNLEETGGAGGLSNIPFECCIQEYGVELEDEDIDGDSSSKWKRMYGLFGVTIRD